MPHVTMKEVAKKAGVSQPLVSLIMNNNKKLKVSEKSRAKVLKIAAELNYQPNHFAQSLKAGRTNFIGISALGEGLGKFDTPYAACVYAGIGRFFSEHNYRLLFHNFKDLASSRRYLELVHSRTVDGILLIVASQELTFFKQKELVTLKKSKLPFVIIHSLADDLQCPAVGLDTVKAGYLGTEHLIRHGYQSIGWFAWEAPVPHFDNLFAGYRQALDHYGQPFDPQQVFRANGAYGPEAGADLADRIIREGRKLPRALFIADDTIAFGAVKKFREAGVRIPEDLAVVGFGDTDSGSSYLTGLTSVSQKAEEKGYQAGAMLTGLIENHRLKKSERLHILEPELTIRTSCGCT